MTPPRKPAIRTGRMVHIQIPRELLAQVDILAERKRWTRTSAILAAIERYLEQEEKGKAAG